MVLLNKRSAVILEKRPCKRRLPDAARAAYKYKIPQLRTSPHVQIILIAVALIFLALSGDKLRKAELLVNMLCAFVVVLNTYRQFSVTAGSKPLYNRPQKIFPQTAVLKILVYPIGVEIRPAISGFIFVITAVFDAKLPYQYISEIKAEYVTRAAFYNSAVFEDHFLDIIIIEKLRQNMQLIGLYRSYGEALFIRHLFSPLSNLREQ